MATPTTIIVSIIVVSLFGLGLFQFSEELLSNYNINEQNFTATRGTLSSVLNQTTSLNEDIESKIEQSGGITVESGFAILAKSTLAAIKLPLNLISILPVLFVEISSNLGVPPYIFAGVMGVLIIVIAFAVFSAILRKDI